MVSAMSIRIEETYLDGAVKLISLDCFADDRGFFLESFHADHFAQIGITEAFVQDNHSGSSRGVVRGLHFQWDRPMAKLMRVTVGRAFCVAVDIRTSSSTLGQWVGVELCAKKRQQLWAPAGFARGFCVLSDYAEVQYKCTSVYNPNGEVGIRWDDPELGIDWPVEQALLSPKDAQAQTLSEWLARPEAEVFS